LKPLHFTTDRTFIPHINKLAIRQYIWLASTYSLNPLAFRELSQLAQDG
jgi:hypothetical protein